MSDMSEKSSKLPAVFKMQNGKLLNKLEFIDYFEKKVFKTIKKFNLFELDDKFVVAVSGGKDSITVLYLAQKYLKRRNLHKNLIALAINEGIEDYREHTLEFLKEFCEQLDVELHIESYKQTYNKTLDSSIKILKEKKKNISPCNICGTFRRTSLNTGARKLGATKVITGHNLDDEAQSILLNIMKNNYKVLPRLGPSNGVVGDEMFIPRIKPLYLCTEKEVRLYTILKGFDVGYDECPYSHDSFRNNLAEAINSLEDKHAGVKSSLVNFFLQTQDILREQYINEEGSSVTYCTKCGEPSQRSICNTCDMRDLIEGVESDS
ncbi:MAG: TIGR00269 family protein [Candidatus Nanoarchaeia archaeon]